MYIFTEVLLTKILHFFSGWRLCDDSRVSSVSHEKNVVTKSAYLLFYRRRQAFVPSPILDNLPEQTQEEHEEYQSASSDIDEDSPQQCDFDGNKGKLVIDESPLVDESSSSYASPLTQDSDSISVMPTINLDDEEEDKDLGYTDMDSVD